MGNRRAFLASSDPSNTPRQAQPTPCGSWLKYVLKSTSQRRDAGKRASTSTKSGKRSMPGRNTRNTVRRELARNDSARTPAQPPSPVSALPGMGHAGRTIALGRRSARGNLAWLSVPRTLHEAGLAQEPGRTGLRPLIPFQHDMVGVLIGASRVIQARRANARQDAQHLAADGQPQVGEYDRVERGRWVVRRKNRLVAAERLETVDQRARHVRSQADGAEASAARLQTARDRRVMKLLAHRAST